MTFRMLFIRVVSVRPTILMPGEPDGGLMTTPPTPTMSMLRVSGPSRVTDSA
jgi:hypothetical protein